MIHRDELPLLLTGFVATLSGVGLARFAYTALMPQMVHAGWFSGEQAAYLGAANLLGYLVGALAAAPLAERLGPARVLLACWAAVVLSFAGCALPQPLPVFFGWRLLSGMAGAALMVLGPSVAMAAAAPARRAVLGPLMFCGIGAGALLSATAVPLFARIHLTAAWWALTALCVLALAVGWINVRRIHPPAPLPFTPTAPMAPTLPLWSAAVVLLLLAYATDGFGFVPHTVFWVDYLDRELQRGSGYAASQWAIFGLGAIAGPLGAAYAASRWGWWNTAIGAYALKATAVGLPLMYAGFAGHAVSGFIVGALSPGIAAITSGYLMLLVGPAQHKKMWGYATAAFALAQASSGYLMAYLYASSGSYRLTYVAGCLALALGTLLVLVSRRARPATTSVRSV